ncbi:MAG: DinB family protein, partial [Usitatibacteraceae bacterium]
ESIMSTATLISLFGYKAWANSQLFTTLSALPPERAEALHTCIRTLNHIYVVDRLFRARLSGEPQPFDATNTVETPSLGKLCEGVEATDAWYQKYASSLTPAASSEILDFIFADGDAGRMSREEILLHVIAHGSYHRGNVGQVLKSIGVAPPRDLYTKFLHQSEPSRRASAS